MAYSFDLLTTAAQCDELLDLTDAELRDLQHRADNFDYALDNTADGEAARTRRLTVVDAQMTSFNTIAAALPDGDEKIATPRTCAGPPPARPSCSTAPAPATRWPSCGAKPTWRS